jgi:hypothetical protein
MASNLDTATGENFPVGSNDWLNSVTNPSSNSN